MRTAFTLSMGFLCLLAGGLSALAEEADEIPELETKPLTTITAAQEEFRLVRLSRDGKTLATGSGLGTLKGAKDTVGAAAFTPDGKTLVVGDYKGTVSIFDVAGRKLRKSFSATLGIVYTTGVSNDGKLAFSGTQGEAPALFNIATGKRIGAVQKQDGITTAFVAADKSRTIVSGGPGQIQFLDEKTGKIRRSVPVGEHSIQALRFSPDEKTLAIGTDIALWMVDVESGKPAVVYDETVSSFNALAFTADGKSLVAVSAPHVMVWDLKTRKRTAQAKFEFRGRGDRVSLSADGSIAALALSDKEVQVLEIPSARAK
jgi:hypothetical protein